MTVKIYDDGSSYAWTPELGKEGIIIRISKSTLTSVGWCAQQMWLEHNYPKPQALVKHLVLGDDVHNGLDMFYQRLDNDSTKENISKILENDGNLKKYLHQFVPNQQDIISNRREDNKPHPFYHEDYQRNMDWLMEYESLRMKMSKGALPLANEVRIEVKVDMDIEGYGTIPIQFVGIIDRIFEAVDGGLMLFELKTGKWSNYKLGDMRKEMAYYKFLIENCSSEYLQERGIDREVTYWGWRYSAADHWTIEKTKTTSQKAMRNQLEKLIKMYLDENFEIAKDNYNFSPCNYCDHMEMCPKYAIEVES